MDEKHLNENQINLFEVFETLLNGKWIIIIITLMFSLIGYGYYKIKPEIFHITFKIQSPRASMFANFIDLNKFLEVNGINYSIIPQRVTELFLNEFYDYQELISVLNTAPSLQTKLNKLNEKEKQEILIQYAKFFNIDPQSKKDGLYIASVHWKNVEEAKDIFNKTIKLTLNNIKKQVNKDVNQLVGIVKQRRLENILKKEEEKEKRKLQNILKKEEEKEKRKLQNILKEQKNIQKNIQHL